MSLYLGDKLVMPTLTISTGGYTGHVDTEGLAAIGWDAEDIAYLQERVWWNEEDDEVFEVPALDKACYQAYLAGEMDGTLGGSSGGDSMLMTLSYIDPDLDTDSTATTDYHDIMFAPKFDFAGSEWSVRGFFEYCVNLVAVPSYDLNGQVALDGMYQWCTALRVVPDITITDSIVGFFELFCGCESMRVAPNITIPSAGMPVTAYMFIGCSSLECICPIDVVNDGGYADEGGTRVFPHESIIGSCNNLITAKISGVFESLDLSSNYRLSTASLRYIIDHALEVEDKELTLPKYHKLTDDEIAVATNKGWMVTVADYLGGQMIR